jgi:hypothetical protein
MVRAEEWAVRALSPRGSVGSRARNRPFMRSLARAPVGAVPVLFVDDGYIQQDRLREARTGPPPLRTQADLAKLTPDCSGEPLSV